MKYGLRDSLRRLVGLTVDTGVLRPGEFWALRNVNFELQKGESLGIMGVNGSGKTTLLRVLNGVYAPDTGEATLRGRVGALIAAGAGFAPMLTGRENIYVNGALLGMTPREIASKMEQIIEFSELGELIDMPVKHYSSGMFVRLGFAIAAVSEPEILLIDEVLAVGDLNFQKKCYEYLHRLKRSGTSIILVSHSVGAIWAICDRGIFVHQGEVKLMGHVEDVIKAYDEQNFRRALSSLTQEVPQEEEKSESGVKSTESSLEGTYGHLRGGTGDAICHTFRIVASGDLEPRSEFQFREPLLFEADIEVLRRIEMPLFRFAIDAVHYKFIAVLDSYEQGVCISSINPGRYFVRVKVPSQNLRPGAYTINLAICRKGFGAHLYYWFGAGSFLIKQPPDRFLYADQNAILHLDGEFSFHVGERDHLRAEKRCDPFLRASSDD
jgi:lipopolysaccharide transport system ATP-binding protein